MKTFCCGIELRKSGIAIGVLQVIAAIYWVCRISLIEIPVISSEVEQLNKNTYTIGEETNEKIPHVLQILLVALYIDFCLFIIHFFVASFLIIGIVTRKASFMSGWISYTCLCFIVDIIMVFIFLRYLDQLEVTPEGVKMFLSVPIRVYFTYVIIQLQNQIKEEVLLETENCQAQAPFTAKV